MEKRGSKKADDARKRPPAKTLEARENQLIAAAVDLAEKQIRAGTASSQVITHFLKLGSTRERIEKDIKIEEAELLRAKRKAIEETRTSGEMYEKALAAMREYSGNSAEDYEC